MNILKFRSGTRLSPSNVSPPECLKAPAVRMVLALSCSMKEFPRIDLTFLVSGVILARRESDKSLTYEPDSPRKKGM